MLICPHCHREVHIPVPTVTPTQLRIVRFIEGYLRAHQYSPTFAEIGEHLGVSSSGTIAEHIRNLEVKGILKRAPTAARGLTLLVRSDEIGELPPPRSDATGFTEDDE